MPEDFLGLDGRSLVVTGASSGIGRASAVLASRQGARVTLIARREEALQETRAAMAGDGHRIVPCDLSDHVAVTAALRETAVEQGALDGLIHAAGIHATTPLRTITAEQVSTVLETNVTDTLMLVKAFRHRQVRGEDPAVVLMSSVAGMVGEAGVSAYAASKAAVAAIGRSLALELSRERIRVNSIAAGIVETALTRGIRERVGEAGWERIEAMHPLGTGLPEDVARAALYLVSSASAWVTGTTLVVDGGYTAQ
ncbi:NAD(P)-dependent dehydrogenase (short-subunit alcohol dehydrogenase family) [Microbacterium resistens]|uniref:NAD(P)-dependent dehydrogenase (Short-subunit alcohol dehydrogenase family) n=1 Tax=Microbacterium resistens TaxID=156977 RepID=A0ABU1S9N3_9MICO|nr:SDR family oxidoreductase [Microbacterium resistens]MDR6866321.1 NAD(P)-dependent dehydrogenase (short-subunit alcohol dehydrogenase family) [Microbacterium resistens]